MENTASGGMCHADLCHMGLDQLFHHMYRCSVSRRDGKSRRRTFHSMIVVIAVVAYVIHHSGRKYRDGFGRVTGSSSRDTVPLFGSTEPHQRGFFQGIRMRMGIPNHDFPFTVRISCGTPWEGMEGTYYSNTENIWDHPKIGRSNSRVGIKV